MIKLNVLQLTFIVHENNICVYIFISRLIELFKLQDQFNTVCGLLVNMVKGENKK